MMHQRYEDLLARRAELSQEDESILVAHLERCAVCQKLAVEYADQDDLLQSFAEELPRVTTRGRVLHRIETAPKRDRSFLVPRYAVAATVAALTFSVCLLAAGLLGGIVSRSGSPSAAAGLAPCTVRGDGWAATGRCREIESPLQFVGPGIIQNTLSLAWVENHLQQPMYIVRKGKGLCPIAYGAAATDVYFTVVAVDTHTHAALYAVGREKP